tara:strand:- start:230 stop:496 length:267 start_codon:yes stop_codon:yes gene_type:complete
MIDKNMSYVMSGAKILKLLELIDDLKDVAIEYAEETDDDVEKIENNYETLMDEILRCEIFSEINYNDMIGQYTLDDIMDKVGLNYSKE